MTKHEKQLLLDQIQMAQMSGAALTLSKVLMKLYPDCDLQDHDQSARAMQKFRTLRQGLKEDDGFGIAVTRSAGKGWDSRYVYVVPTRIASARSSVQLLTGGVFAEQVRLLCGYIPSLCQADAERLIRLTHLMADSPTVTMRQAIAHVFPERGESLGGEDQGGMLSLFRLFRQRVRRAGIPIEVRGKQMNPLDKRYIAYDRYTPGFRAVLRAIRNGELREGKHGSQLVSAKACEEAIYWVHKRGEEDCPGSPDCCVPEHHRKAYASRLAFDMHRKNEISLSTDELECHANEALKAFPSFRNHYSMNPVKTVIHGLTRRSVFVPSTDPGRWEIIHPHFQDYLVADFLFNKLAEEVYPPSLTNETLHALWGCPRISERSFLYLTQIVGDSPQRENGTTIATRLKDMRDRPENSECGDLARRVLLAVPHLLAVPQSRAARNLPPMERAALLPRWSPA